MKQNVDCSVFRDRVEDFRHGRLAPEAAAWFHRHAESCPHCATLLRLQEHVAMQGLEDPEAAVPEEYVTTMWERVQDDIATRGWALGRRSRDRHLVRWLVPALAAASAFLLLTSGLLLVEWNRLRAREAVLVQRIADNERRLTMFEAGTAGGPVARTAGLVGTPAWVRLLARRRSVSVAELEALVAGLPAGTTVLNASDWRELEAGIPVWMRSLWIEAAEAIRAEDGVQSEELAALLARLDLEPERSVPTARILALTVGGTGRL